MVGLDTYSSWKKIQYKQQMNKNILCTINRTFPGIPNNKRSNVMLSQNEMKACNKIQFGTRKRKKIVNSQYYIALSVASRRAYNVHPAFFSQ